MKQTRKQTYLRKSIGQRQVAAWVRCALFVATVASVSVAAKAKAGETEPAGALQDRLETYLPPSLNDERRLQERDLEKLRDEERAKANKANARQNGKPAKQAD